MDHYCTVRDNDGHEDAVSCTLVAVLAYLALLRNSSSVFSIVLFTGATLSRKQWYSSAI
ncbi:hypothetical protein ECDEC1D_0648 [Escherichia coli DEC1D]|nr:hypothetical protein ECDEC1D_0648 [Escherichia coli DEC1D]